MGRSKLKTHIYFATDAREAIALAGSLNYQPYDNSIKLNGTDFPIEDLPMVTGRDLQKRLGLSFNPMSFIVGDMTDREVSILVGRFVREKIYSAYVNNEGLFGGDY